MLFKYTLKNIFAKKGRLIIIMICMVAACFTAFMAADMGSSISDILMEIILVDKGTADYLVYYTGTEGITDSFFEGLPESKNVGRSSITKREIRRDEKQYNIALTDTLELMSFSDWDAAVDMKLLKPASVPKEGYVTINRHYSDKYGYKEGDTIILTDSDANEYPFIVGTVFEDTASTKDRFTGFITFEDITKVSKKKRMSSAYVDVLDDSERDNYEKALLEKYPTASANKMYAADMILEVFNMIKMIFYLMFVLMFLLVVFVTVSFTERIINERMSVIGTLRSIGVSMKKTAFILLFENVMYALMGSLIAFFAYFILRKVLFAVAASLGSPVDIGEIKPLTVLIVITGAILVQILIPGLEMLKAVKTSIRDIIFDTKDSEYKLSYPRVALGAGLILAGFVFGFIIRNMYFCMIALIMVVAGATLVLPIILRLLSKVLKRVFEKLKMPVAELASTEAGSKKHNFGSAVLAVASILVTSVVFVAGYSMLQSMKTAEYNADVIVSDAKQRITKYEFINEIEGVDSLDFVYYQDSIFGTVGFGDGQKTGFEQFCFSDISLYSAMGELETPEKNEIILNAAAANKLGVFEGDTITLTFHVNDLFPMEREVKVKQISKKSSMFGLATMILSEEMYKELYSSVPDKLLIRSSNPEQVEKELKDSLTSGEVIKTRQEIVEEEKKANTVTFLVLYGIIIGSVILTLIGISGNQVIAFASRKKEYAMLHSTACAMKSIVRLILIENGIVFGIAGLIAFILTLPVSQLTSRVFVLANMSMDMQVNFGVLFLYILGMWGITMLTAITPIRNLKKMNTATEMKYE